MSLRPSEWAVRVVGPDGREVAAQVVGEQSAVCGADPGGGLCGLRRSARLSREASSTLKVTESSLENHRYRVNLNSDGDVASIFDKQLNRELLAAPMRLAIKNDTPAQWPAWNMDWTDQQKPPRAYVSGPAKIRVVESGPVRVADRSCARNGRFEVSTNGSSVCG